MNLIYRIPKISQVSYRVAACDVICEIGKCFREIISAQCYIGSSRIYRRITGTVVQYLTFQPASASSIALLN